MNSFAFCTASSFASQSLFLWLKNRYTNSKITFHADVIHLQFQEDVIKEIFYFPYGVSVFWGFLKKETVPFLEELKEFEEGGEQGTDEDAFTFSFGKDCSIVEDEIILPNKNSLIRLAISHGIAQSVKLGVFEAIIRRTFEATKYIPEDLAKYGRISLSRKEIRRKMGELFIQRSSIHMHADVLDTPEFFWKNPELDPFYLMTANYLDLKTRLDILNQRLDVIHELFEMLGNELNHQHSNLLEWTIIWLIVTEVVLTLMKDFF